MLPGCDSARRSASFATLFAPARAPCGAPGKAVRIRRDPVTVIGDETRERPLAAEAGKARGVG